MTDRIDVGEIVHITNGEGFQLKPSLELFDPTDVVCDVRAPDGTVTRYTDATGPAVVRAEEGLYYVDVAVDQSGLWWFRWDGDQVIEEGQFVVRNRRVPEPE